MDAARKATDTACRINGMCVCYTYGMPANMDAWTKVVETSDGSDDGGLVLAVFSWRPTGTEFGKVNGTAAVSFFSSRYSGVLEMRVWHPQWTPTEDEMREIAEDFSISPKWALTTDEFRRVPWGEMSARASAHFTAVDQAKSEGFQPPRWEDVEDLIEHGDFAGFRTSRDLRGHSQQLRAVHTYLQAVVDLEESGVAPVAAIADSEGISPSQARSLLERARTTGYISRPTHRFGGEIQPLADEVAERIDKAVRERRGAGK